ncbi:FkbM family methyltransferase [Kiloniella sp.]|uniref:FkbM family methyltransferase n=1 Tax=Kiloniella sp. TaxID=1938587 RepID=UPI003B0104D2
MFKSTTSSPLISFDEKIQDALLPSTIYSWIKTRKFSRKGEKELELVPFLARSDKAAIDIGANKGVWTHRLLQTCPEVYAFEPNPKMYRRLEKCFGKRARVSPIAISNETGSSVLRIPKTSGGYSSQLSTLSSVQEFDDHLPVDVITSKLDDQKIDNVGFIKIDVEGFELQVLEGAKETIERDKPVLVIEIEEAHTKKDISSSIALVEALGYDTFVIADGVFQPLQNAHAGKQKSHSGEYLFNFIFIPKSNS